MHDSSNADSDDSQLPLLQMSNTNFVALGNEKEDLMDRKLDEKMPLRGAPSGLPILYPPTAAGGHGSASASAAGLHAISAVLSSASPSASTIHISGGGRRKSRSTNVAPAGAVGIDLRRAVGIDAQSGWNNAMPDDVFVHAFSFLEVTDVVSAARVNSGWHACTQEPTLWRTLDLSRLYNKVDDDFVCGLIMSNRFRHLTTLSLEGCCAISERTIVTIASHCRELKHLFLTECDQIPAPVILELVRAVPLDILELYRCTSDYMLVPEIKAIRPYIGLNLFWMEYCAHSGTALNSRTPAVCRHEGRVQAQGCWGAVKAHLVYSNVFYHRRGNYPEEILYYCSNHSGEDEKDEAYHKCQTCECLFRQESMWNDLLCRTCFDRSNLTNKNNWISLSRASIQGFTFSDIINKTVTVADRRNLPPALKHYGSVPCRLDYRMPANANGDEKRVWDLSAVPVSTFMERNKWTIDSQVDTIKDSLSDARSASETRALLCFDEKENVEVMADKQIILDGVEGEDHMKLTVQAWGQALPIIYPIALVMLIATYMTSVIRDVFADIIADNGSRTNYTLYLSNGGGTGISTETLIVGAVLVILIVLMFFMMYRFREQCEWLFKRFLVLDFLAIFASGFGLSLYCIVIWYQFELDLITFFVACANFGAVGLYSMYYSECPNTLHHFFLICLNAILAVMFIFTLGKWFIFFFICVAALADFYADMRPGVRFIAPFVLPSNLQLLYNTPRVLYHVGVLRLRAADLMWYAGMISLISFDVTSITCMFVGVLSGLVLTVFILPFFGKMLRPLPLSFVCVVLAMVCADSVIAPYVLAGNTIHVTNA